MPIQPFSGIRSAHGREMGVIECWYTRADKLPKKWTEKRQRQRTNRITMSDSSDGVQYSAVAPV